MPVYCWLKISHHLFLKLIGFKQNIILFLPPNVHFYLFLVFPENLEENLKKNQ